MLKILFIGVAILVSGLSLQPSMARADEAAAAGTVKELSGSEEIQVINAKRGGSRSVKAREEIFEGDKIITREGQSLVLELAERSQIVIAPMSSFTVETFQKSGGGQQSLFHIFYGGLRALVKKVYSDEESFIVKSPNAVMGVRGTTFDVSVSRSSGLTQVHTLNGTVAMAATLEQIRKPGGVGVVLVATGTQSLMKKGARQPETPAAFNVEQYRLKEKGQFPGIKSIDSESGARDDHSKNDMRAGADADQGADQGADGKKKDKKHVSRNGVDEDNDTASLSSNAVNNRRRHRDRRLRQNVGLTKAKTIMQVPDGAPRPSGRPAIAADPTQMNPIEHPRGVIERHKNPDDRVTIPMGQGTNPSERVINPKERMTERMTNPGVRNAMPGNTNHSTPAGEAARTFQRQNIRNRTQRQTTGTMPRLNTGTTIHAPTHAAPIQQTPTAR